MIVVTAGLGLFLVVEDNAMVGGRSGGGGSGLDSRGDNEPGSGGGGRFAGGVPDPRLRRETSVALPRIQAGFESVNIALADIGL